MAADTEDPYESQLSLADQRWTSGDIEAATQHLAGAAASCFDRRRHFDGLTSPIAVDASRYLQAWRSSPLVRRLGEPRARSVDRAGRRDEDQATRVLVVTRKNANFLPEIREYLDESAGVEQRFLDLADFPRLNKYASSLALTAEQILGDAPELRQILERRVSPHIEWADVVFVEWCLQQAVFLTLLDPGPRRVIVRLHSQEIFTPWPHLVDFSRVDDVVFVSKHLRDLAVEVIPALRGEDPPRLHVIPNALKLERFVQPKSDEARFNIGLVGWGHVAKDPGWALDVLEVLRATEERYTLHLYGADFRTDFSDAAAEYGARLLPRIEELERQGAVVRHGHTDDVPGVLRDIGVILSSSVRESFHASVVEGAASGAVPVLRDWPFFAGKPNSARTLFSEDWVVATPQEAADRIVAVTSEASIWRDNGAESSRLALSEFDWEVVKHQFDELFRRRPDRQPG